MLIMSPPNVSRTSSRVRCLLLPQPHLSSFEKIWSHRYSFK